MMRTSSAGDRTIGENGGDHSAPAVTHPSEVRAEEESERKKAGNVERNILRVGPSETKSAPRRLQKCFIGDLKSCRDLQIRLTSDLIVKSIAGALRE